MNRGFDDEPRRSGAAPIAPGNYKQVRFRKALGEAVIKGRKKGRGKSTGDIVKTKGREKGRSKCLGTVPQGKIYGSADLF